MELEHKIRGKKWNIIELSKNRKTEEARTKLEAQNNRKDTIKRDTINRHTIDC